MTTPPPLPPETRSYETKVCGFELYPDQRVGVAVALPPGTPVTMSTPVRLTFNPPLPPPPSEDEAIENASLRARVAELEAEVARVTAERDENERLCLGYQSAQIGAEAERDAARSALAASEATVSRLTGALRHILSRERSCDFGFEDEGGGCRATQPARHEGWCSHCLAAEAIAAELCSCAQRPDPHVLGSCNPCVNPHVPALSAPTPEE